jgi:hypothetical protein
MMLWRIHLRPDSEDGFNVAQFCFDRNIVGIGWAVEGNPSTKDEYYRLGEQIERDPSHRKAWIAATNAILTSLGQGDLIWARTPDARYYLGRIAGEWRYENSDEYRRADVVNVRPCEWVPIGAVDAVPGAVINAFRPRRTIQRVSDPDALTYSMFVYARKRGEPFKPDGAKRDIIALVSDEDLEDVAAVYLQVVEHCVMFPSTCKPDTMTIEAIFARPDGTRVGLQVKSGQALLNQDQFASFDGEVYLFAASTRYEGSPNPNCHCLERDVIRQFIFDNRHLMTTRVQNWIEFAQATEGT